MKRAAEEQNLALQDGQSIMQVVSLRGSNLIEVIHFLFYYALYIKFQSFYQNIRVPIMGS